MIVNQTAEYALRAVAYLAALPPGRRARTVEVAEAASIPSHYLSKVMRKLVVAGICDSKKGHHGGFALLAPANEISFLEVIRAADFDAVPDRCAFGLAVCDPDHPCPLHDAWTEMKVSFVSWAAGTTMADTRVLGERPEPDASDETSGGADSD